MKITINVDCTPEEARTFLGLPDVKPMQESLLKEMEARLRKTAETMDPEALMKLWLPMTPENFGMEGLEKMTKAFWSGFSGKGGKDGVD